MLLEKTTKFQRQTQLTIIEGGLAGELLSTLQLTGLTLVMADGPET